MESIICFDCRDKSKNMEKVIDLLYKGEIFKMVRFQWKCAQINCTAMYVQKCIFCHYATFRYRLMEGERSASIDTT